MSWSPLPTVCGAATQPCPRPPSSPGLGDGLSGAVLTPFPGPPQTELTAPLETALHGSWGEVASDLILLFLLSLSL